MTPTVRGRTYLHDDMDDWYIAQVTQADDGIKSEYRERAEEEMRQAREAKHEGDALRIEKLRDRHLGAPLDFNRETPCHVCGRLHGKLP